jgi:AcrR family transcriptional regulator
VTTPVLAGPPSPGARRVLDVALDLFSRQGYDGTSLQLIADRLGVTKAAVYYHFRTKGEILAALLQPALDDLDHLTTQAAACGRPGTRREAGLRGYVEYLLRHRQVAAFLARDVAALAQPEVREPLEELTRRMRVLLTTGLDGRARPPAQPDPRAQLWAAATLRGLSEALLVAPPACSDEWLRGELLELGRHLIAGYRKQRGPRRDHATDPMSSSFPLDS